MNDLDAFAQVNFFVADNDGHHPRTYIHMSQRWADVVDEPMDLVLDAVTDAFNPTPLEGEDEANSTFLWLQREYSKLMRREALLVYRESIFKKQRGYASDGQHQYSHDDSRILPPDTYRNSDTTSNTPQASSNSTA